MPKSSDEIGLNIFWDSDFWDFNGDIFCGECEFDLRITEADDCADCADDRNEEFNPSKRDLMGESGLPVSFSIGRDGGIWILGGGCFLG